MTHIHILIPTLNAGGAERYAIDIATGLKALNYRVSIGVLREGGVLWEKMRRGNSGVEFVNYDFRGLGDPGLFNRVYKYISEEKADLIQGMMPPCNFVSVLVGRKAGIPAFMGLMASSHENLRLRDRTYFFLDRLIGNAWAQKIISNSMAGIRYHAEFGYDDKKMVLIPNPLDESRFDGNMTDGKLSELKEGKWRERKIVGTIARIHRLKNYPNFIRAMEIVMKKRSDVAFLIVGTGDTDLVDALQRQIDSAGFGDRLLWLKNVKSVEMVYRIMDLFVLASDTEGLSYALMEAMYTGTPVVATDVGDASRLIDEGKNGKLVPPNDSAELAAAVLDVLSDENRRKNFGQLSREKIMKDYSFKSIIAKYSAAVEDSIRHAGTV